MLYVPAKIIIPNTNQIFRRYHSQYHTIPYHTEILSWVCRRHVGSMSPRHDNVAKFCQQGPVAPTSFLANLAVPATFYVSKCRHFIDMQEYYTTFIYQQWLKNGAPSYLSHVTILPRCAQLLTQIIHTQASWDITVPPTNQVKEPIQQCHHWPLLIV